MLRHLLLLRHGKAKAHDPGGDHARPLKRRGHLQARDVGDWLAGEALTIDLALVSTAVRARETAAGVLEEMADADVREQHARALYLAEAGGILAQIRAVPRGCRGLLVVGHNPGLSQLAAELAAPAEVPELPTGGLALLSFDGEWPSLARARLELWRRPETEH